MLNVTLEGEINAHMDVDKPSRGNNRNSCTSKQVQTSLGEVIAYTPCDRESTFDPEFVKKA